MLEGKNIAGQQAVRMQCSIHMYEAEIAVQAILSYKWLADQNFMVHPRRHGLYFQGERLDIFVPGITEEEGRPHAARLDKVVAIMLQSVPLGLTSAVGISPEPPYPLSAEAQGKKRVNSPSPKLETSPLKGEESSEESRGRSRNQRWERVRTSRPPSPPLSRPSTPLFQSQHLQMLSARQSLRFQKTPDAGPIFGYRLHRQSISRQRLRGDNPGQ